MEIKVGEKYLWDTANEAVEVEVLAGPDVRGYYSALYDGVLCVISESHLKPLRTPEEVERDKLHETLRDMGVTATHGRVSVADYILENYIAKSDPRVVEPVDLSNCPFRYAANNCIQWMIENKHICEKKD